jgi:hypothetical protein
LKGRGFSRAATIAINIWALAPEVTNDKSGEQSGINSRNSVFARVLVVGKLEFQ